MDTYEELSIAKQMFKTTQEAKLNYNMQGKPG